MKRHFRTLLPILAAALCALPAWAQPGAAPGGGGMNTALLKLLGKNTTFTAKGSMRMLDGTQKEMATMPFQMAMLEDKTRIEMDMSEMKGQLMPPQVLAQMKSAGVEKNIFISRPDKKVNYIVNAGANGYVEVPFAKEELASLDTRTKVEKSSLGKETIDGHACTKNKAIVTDGDGKAHEFTTWNATDLKDFPIQLQTTENGFVVIMQYKNVQFTKTDARQFEPPIGLTKFANAEAMNAVVMQRLMNAAAPPGTK